MWVQHKVHLAFGIFCMHTLPAFMYSFAFSRSPCCLAFRAANLYSFCLISSIALVLLFWRSVRMNQCGDLHRAYKMCIPCCVHLFKPAFISLALNHTAILLKPHLLQSPEVLSDIMIQLPPIKKIIINLLVNISKLFRAWNSMSQY